MKTLRSVFVACLLTASGFSASAYNNEFSFRHADRLPMVVEFDHYMYQQPVTEFRIADIPAGRHSVKVWSASGYNHGHHYSGYLLYNGFIDVRDGMSLQSILGRNRVFRTVSLVAMAPVCAPVYQNTSYYQPAYNSVMCPAEFDALMRIIEARNFDSSRLTIAKQAIRDHQLNTMQVSALMGLLTFESSKLELAKYAYANTVDRSNYYRLYDQFTFDSSVDELNRYISCHS